jgi:hypothetical protein
MGCSSTHRSLCAETGVDTLRELFKVAIVPPRRYDVELAGTAWVVDPLPAHGLVAIEGNPAGGALWSPDELQAVDVELQAHVDERLGLVDGVGVSRLDLTTSRRFAPTEGRAFLAGMAALELPRLEATRRGTPVHSAWWTGEHSATIKCRVYDEAFKLETREAFERIRLEDQRRYRAAERPPLDVAADPEFQRQAFLRRFEPMRRAVDGVKAASFPVVAQAIADEFRYGYRSLRESERLAASLVLLTGGAREGYARSTFYKRRAELREAGYVVVDDFMEPVEVDLGGELERACEEFGT